MAIQALERGNPVLLLFETLTLFQTSLWIATSQKAAPRNLMYPHGIYALANSD
jgi:hypothetical protein